jgi:peptidoglycan L-alanyl-D-glutamate endopeptidase CwlK
MTRSLSPKSLERLGTIHPDLQRLVQEIAKSRDIVVVCGWRSKEDQDMAVLNKTTTLEWPRSKHNHFPSWAVDLAPYSTVAPHIRWNDLEAFKALGEFTVALAKDMNIPINWGGHWVKFKDYPHYELVGRPKDKAYKLT